MFLVQKLEEIVRHSSDSKLFIADFLLKERKNIKNFSMQQIANITFTSKPTLVRFAKALDFAGWTDFINAYIDESHHRDLLNQEIDPNFPFQEEDSIETIIEHLKMLQINSISETASGLESANLEKIAEVITESRYVTIFGMNPNSLLGELFKRRMESIGKIVTVASLDNGGMLAEALTDKDCAIAISYSGNNPIREPMKYLSSLKKHKVPIIGITSNDDNYIRQMSDYVLTIVSHERLYSKISGFSTEESTNFILNVLFSTCFSKDYTKNYQYKLRNSKQLEYRRQANLNDMIEPEK